MNDDFVENTLKKARLDFKLFEVEDSITVFKKKLESMIIDEINKAKIIRHLVELRQELKSKILLLEILRKFHNDQEL